MAASPSPLNYFVGKGTLVYTPDGGSARSLGNAPSFKTTPNLEFLPHYSSQTGIKEKDDEVLVSKSGTVEITLDEITIENLALALFGEVETNSDGDEEFEILAVSAQKGELVMTGTNDKGNRFVVTVNQASFKPTEGADFISEEFGVLSLSAEMLSVNGVFGTVVKIADGTL